MEQIPTALEMFEANPILPPGVTSNACIAFMKTFTKMHVEAALKDKIEAMYEKQNKDSSYSIDGLDACTEDSYPLSNIK
jgi:hypothetical protein